MRGYPTLNSFLLRLLQRLSPAYLIVGLVAVLYVYLMKFIDHEQVWIANLIIILALLKTGYFSFFTFRQAGLFIQQCHSFRQLLWVFGMLTFLIIFSFAADFNCLAENNEASFSGLPPDQNFSYPERLFEFFYFSFVTFASIGYGDIVPVTIDAKMVVILEIAQSFVMVVFGLSNISNIHVLINRKMES